MEPTKPTVEEALSIVLAHGYEIAHPNAGGIPKKWLDLAKVVLLVIASVSGLFTAQNVAQKPAPATPEQVKEAVKEAAPTPKQIAVEVWKE